MRERVACEFFLIRYVPDVVKGEFANIGVVLREAGAAPGAGATHASDARSDARADARPNARADAGQNAGPRLLVRFTRDWSRVRCLDAEADVAMLESLEAEIVHRLATDGGASKPVLQVLEDSLSNSVQITMPRACLAESIPAEIEQLMRMYVEPMKVKLERKRTGRAAIGARMRTEFERAGVWGLMRKRIGASLYTAAGDPLKIDCGYRPNGVIRMFQAVSLDGDVEAAKVLAYSVPQLRDGVARVEGAGLELTAVVEPVRQLRAGEDDEAGERYRFGVETMERQAIRVMTVSDLPRIAETARVELRV